MSDQNPKFQLNLNETNSLGFTLTIEGSANDVDATKPEFRFVLSENGNERSWLYPMVRDEEGDVVVQIPSEEFFSESKEYKGRVEVILGNHFFVPAVVEIDFIRPLKVEAVAKVKTKTAAPLKEEAKQLSVSTAAVKAKTKEPIKQAVQEKKTWNDLTFDEQEKVKKIILEKKRAELQRQKMVEGKKPTTTPAKQKSIKEQMKDAIFSSIIIEDEDE